MKWDGFSIKKKNPIEPPAMLSLEDQKKLAKKLASYIMFEKYPAWHSINFLEIEGENKPIYPFLLIHKFIRTIHTVHMPDSPTPRTFLRPKKINLCVPVFFQPREIALPDEIMAELDSTYHAIILGDNLRFIADKIDQIIDKFNR